MIINQENDKLYASLHIQSKYWEEHLTEDSKHDVVVGRMMSINYDPYLGERENYILKTIKINDSVIYTHKNYLQYDSKDRIYTNTIIKVGNEFYKGIETDSPICFHQ